MGRAPGGGNLAGASLFDYAYLIIYYHSVQVGNHKEGRVQEEERLSLREAADALGVSEVTARRWIKSGKLKAYQPGRKYLIPRSAVDELLESESPKDRSSSLEPKLFNGAQDELREPETAEKLLRFGERMVAQWESELPARLEAEDEEWLRLTWTMYHEFMDILNGIKPGKSSNKQELLGRLMDINATAQRIVEMVYQHNERSLEAGKKVLVLEETA